MTYIIILFILSYNGKYNLWILHKSHPMQEDGEFGVQNNFS